MEEYICEWIYFLFIIYLSYLKISIKITPISPNLKVVTPTASCLSHPGWCSTSSSKSLKLNSSPDIHPPSSTSFLSFWLMLKTLSSLGHHFHTHWLLYPCVQIIIKPWGLPKQYFSSFSFCFILSNNTLIRLELSLYSVNPISHFFLYPPLYISANMYLVPNPLSTSKHYTECPLKWFSWSEKKSLGRTNWRSIIHFNPLAVLTLICLTR